MSVFGWPIRVQQPSNKAQPHQWRKVACQKRFPKSQPGARKVLKHFPWDLVPPWCIQHPAPKVRRYGNMKTSIKTTVGILQQSVEVINTDIRCDGMHQSHHGLQSPRILLMRQCQSSSHCHEKVNVAPVPYIIVKVHSTCASPSACSKL